MGLVDPNLVTNYSQITPAMRPTVPIIFFIDRSYTIRAQYFGNDPFFEAQDQGAAIRGEINKLLAPAAKPAAPARPARKASKGK